MSVEAVFNLSQTIISPFLEHPRQLPVLNTRLEDYQRRTLESMSIPVVEAQSRDEKKGLLVIKDTVFLSRELLTIFLEQSQHMNQPTQLAVKKGGLTERTTVSTMDVDDHGDSIGYRVNYYPPGSDSRTASKPVVIDSDEYVQEIRFPGHMVPEGRYRVPITRRIIVQIEHWTNLWSCNIAALLSNIAGLKSDRPRQLQYAIRALSVNQWRVSSKNVQIGKECDIHPTAYVENSIIGDKVEIGAMSVVRGSMVGDGSVINNNCTVAYSVLGEECQLRDGAIMTYSLLFPGAFTTSPLVNTSVMGRDSFFPVGSVITDYRFDGKCVTVIKDGKVVDSGNVILGCCLGHNAYVGAGVFIRPGREIPNGARLLPTYTEI